MALTLDGTVETDEFLLTSGSGTSGDRSLSNGPYTLDRTLILVSVRNEKGVDRPNRQSFRVYLSESNPGVSGYDQFTWERDNAASIDDIYLYVQVVQFDSGSAKVYQGNADATDDLSGTVSTIDTGAASLTDPIPFLNFKTDQTAWFTQEHAPEPTISGTDLVLTFGAAPSAGNMVLHWQVLDLLSDVSTDTGSVTLTAATASGTDTISVTDTADCIVLLHASRNANALAAPDTQGPGYVTIDSTSQLTCARYVTGGGGDTVLRWYLIEFTGSDQTVEAGSVSLAYTDASKDATLSNITDLSQTVVWNASIFGQREVGNDGQDPSEWMYTGEVYDNGGAETYQAARYAAADSSSETLDVYYWLTQIDQASAAVVQPRPVVMGAGF